MFVIILFYHRYLLHCDPKLVGCSRHSGLSLWKVVTVRYDGAYSDLVISVQVFHLFHNNECGYSWYVFIAETMYNLWIPNYCYLLWAGPLTLTTETGFQTDSNSCTILCMVLNIHLWQVLLAGASGSLIGCLPVTLNGAPNLHVADSLGWCLFGTVHSFQIRKSTNFVQITTCSSESHFT